MTSRRSILTGAVGVGTACAIQARQRPRDSVLNLQRAPDYAVVHASGNTIPLSRTGARWTAPGISVTTEPSSSGLPIVLSASGVEPNRIHLRWTVRVPGEPLVLGDAWERSYGDLGWRPIIPERVMPWYFLVWSGGVADGYGVQTQSAALCFWQLDAEGISLWLDVSNGGSGVDLGQRELVAATVITRQGSRGETPVESATAFCRELCGRPRLSQSRLYGSNDWYYAYGKNSAEGTLRDAALMAELSHGNQVRPFTIVDMGWRDGSPTFPSMPDLASRVKRTGVRPGLWIRPLEATKDISPNLLLPAARFGKLSGRSRELAFDPTIPEGLDVITSKVRNPVSWGYELIKHDFSTYDLLGKWGREMGAEPTSPGWHLHDRTRTNAEIILDLYRALRNTAGDHTLLIGCNTIGHLGAGLFEAQRTGDDTSGRDWERTRRMGVNTLAFRLPQHNTFFSVDPDCVGITAAIPWDLNRQWLDLIASTGVALFVSPDRAATGKDQRAAIQAAFAKTVLQNPRSVPKNWFRDSTPESWVTLRNGSSQTDYRWCNPSGCSPFDV